MSEADSKDIWRKLSNLDGDVRVLRERMDKVEKVHDDISCLRREIEKLNQQSSHNQGATTAKKWMISTFIASGGLFISVLVLFVRLGAGG